HFELLEEQALAADARERPIEDQVAARAQRHQLDRERRMLGAQARRDVIGLPERERALAGGDAQKGRRWGEGARGEGRGTREKRAAQRSLADCRCLRSTSRSGPRDNRCIAALSPLAPRRSPLLFTGSAPACAARAGCGG